MIYVSETDGVYLEDSHLLGIVADGRDLRLLMEFALTADHPDYASPNSGEAHCYRKGAIVIGQPQIAQWVAGRPHLLRGPDGEFDLGSVELYRAGPTTVRLATEWFELTAEVERFSIAVS